MTAAPLGMYPTADDFFRILKRPPFNVGRVVQKGVAGEDVFIFVRRDAEGRVWRAVWAGDWEESIDPIVLADILEKLGIETYEYADAVNEDAGFDND